ncbi:MAG: DUF1080 domain-containing protein [Bryobacteraceae bacterium]
MRLPSIVVAALISSALASADNQEWLPLFNGRDLTGWSVKITGYNLTDNFANTFRVENGVLKVAYDGYDEFKGRFGHIFYRHKFSYYRLRAEYRFTGQQATGGPSWAFRNSGLMIHCQDPATIGKDQEFPISIEVQLLGGNGITERTTANVCSPGTHIVMNGALVTKHCNNSTSKTYHGDQWVTVEVEVLGDTTIRHIVDARTVLEYDKPQIGGSGMKGVPPGPNRDGELLSEGYISLQSESHPIEFRRVELLNLAGCKDPRATNFKSYYVKADPASCRY